MTGPLYPGATSSSQQTYALSQIDSTKYPDTNKDFEANMGRLNTWVDYIASYLQTMQKGIDQANQDALQKVQSLVSGIEEMFAGGQGLFGIDLGNLQYYLPAIGALLGFNTTDPFPINLFDAAENFFLGYIVPLSSFASTINGFITPILEDFGINANFIQAAQNLINAFQNVTNDVESFLSNMWNVLTVFGVTSGGLSPFSDLWHAITTLLGGFSLTNLGAITNPIFLALAPWVQDLADLVNTIGDAITAIENITNPFGQLLQNFLSFTNIFGWLNIPGANFSNFSEWFQIPGLTAISNLIVNVSTALANLVDLLFNKITGSNASGVSYGLLGDAVKGLADLIQNAMNGIDTILNVVGKLFGMVQQLVDDILNIPIFKGIEDLLNNIEGAISGWWNNIVQSLTGQNPGTAANTTQINALWTQALNAGGVSISQNFSYGTALSSSWGVVETYALPTVSGAGTQDFVYDVNGNMHYAIYKTPLATQNNYVSCIVKYFGSNVYGPVHLILCAQYNTTTTTLGEYVVLEFDHQWYGNFLRIVSYTGPGTGRVVQATGSPSVNVGDVLGIAYDEAENTFAMFRNEQQVGQTWTDTGNIINHSTGYLYTGLVTNASGLYYNGASPDWGTGIGQFVAYDAV
jgi:hypothetical protein